MSLAVDFARNLARDAWANRINNSATTCTATRVTGTTFNNTTGETEETTTTVLTGVACLVRPASAREVDFGEDRRQEVDFDLYLLHDSTALETDDEVVFTSTVDPNLPTVTVLRWANPDSYLTRKHYECKVVTDA